MVYSRAWDEASPEGTAPANTLDTIIQNKMKDIRERLEDSFPDWTDDAVDPKRVVVHSGNSEDRPDALAANQGEVFLDIEGDLVSFFNGTVWVDFAANAVAANVDLDGAPGAQASSEIVVGQTVYMRCNGTTDGSGEVVLDVSELDISDFEIGDSQVRVYIPMSPHGLMQLVEGTTTASTVTLLAIDHANSALLTTSVTFLAIFVLSPS